MTSGRPSQRGLRRSWSFKLLTKDVLPESVQRLLVAVDHEPAHVWDGALEGLNPAFPCLSRQEASKLAPRSLRALHDPSQDPGGFAADAGCHSSSGRVRLEGLEPPTF